MSSSSEPNRDGQPDATGRTDQRLEESGKAGLGKNVKLDGSQSGSTGVDPSDQVSGVKSWHQRLVFTDPVAFRYLEEDHSTTVLERRGELVGYEVYVVEQWACSRVDPTFVITTFTGLPHHTVVVGVLSVPTNEKDWSPRLRVYLKAISKFHARRKETPLGILMVTNLSGFPSALNVIAVPKGDVRSHREDFIVNEDLKRLGCSGRAGMSLGSPVGATETKFLQLYRTSESIPLRSTVIELVKLCQVALVMFTKLAPEYADGLLCDVTERAINDWWTEVGMDYFNVEPSDGILGPTTVAALLGMLIGSRNRLNAYGAPVGKDVFDLKATKRGIAYFQKSQKIPKTRRLDRQTLNRLHRATSKAANSEGWAVPRAVKSTVAELSGKGGEMVMGMVGGRDKAGIAEIETLDMGNFIQAVSGERCKWLWLGKPRKSHPGELFGALTGEDEMVFSGDEAGGYMWSSRKRDSVAEQGPNTRGGLNHLYLQPSQDSQNSLEAPEKDQAFRKNVLKSVTGKMSDARSGLGRFKDAVGIPGLRGHHHKDSRDESIPCNSAAKGQGGRYSQSHTDLSTPQLSPKDGASLRAEPPPPREPIHHTPDDTAALPPAPDELQKAETAFLRLSIFNGDTGTVTSPDIQIRMSSIQGHARNAGQLNSDDDVSNSGDAVSHNTPPRTVQRPDDNADFNAVSLLAQSNFPAMQSTQSLCQLSQEAILNDPRTRWPRHLSFSVMDNIVLDLGEDLGIVEAANTYYQPKVASSNELYLSLKAGNMVAQLQQLELRDRAWIGYGVRLVEELNQAATRDQEDLDTIYHRKLGEQVDLEKATAKVAAEERASLSEGLKNLELLGAKLEYELNALRSKVEDVEDGVTEFDRQVQDLETRARDLEGEAKIVNGWSTWLFNICFGRN
ncbi:hypothetical protein MMC30_003183 [Trapelia coarctata]|nr:hypothetical protein [Trapelia coarctata]